MKKFLSFMMMTLLTVAAWAGTVTFTPGTVSGTTTDTSADEMTSGGITFSSTSAALARTDNYRFYASSTTTVTSTAGMITEIVFTCNSDAYASTLKNATFSAGSAAVSGSVVTWTGKAESFTFKPTAQVRVDQIVVTVEDGTQALAAPTILLNGETPKSTYSTDELPLTLTITSNNGTDTPYYVYSLAEDPTIAASSVRADATELNLGESTTTNLKVGANKLYAAEAVYNSETQGFEASAWANVSFTITEPLAQLTSLVDVNALADGTGFNYAAQTVVMGKKNKNLFIVMPDNTAGTMVYDAKNNWADSYTFGQVINAGWSGSKTTYRTKPEITEVTDFALAEQTAEVTPIEITANDLTLANFGRYAVIKGVAVADGGLIASITTYDQFGTMSGILAGTYDVYGVIGWDNNNGQFMPLEYVNAAPAGEDLTISMTAAAEGTVYKPVTVTIETNNENALVSYKLNGGEEQDYTEPFTLYETTTVTVYATDGDQEATAEATYTIDLPTSLATVNAFDDDTEFYFNADVTVLGQTGNNLYVQDNNGAGTYIYGNVNQTYNFGDIIAAGWTGTKTIFRGAPEVKNPADFAAATQNVAPTAIELTPDQVGLDNFIRYAVIKGATFDGTNITVGESNVAIYNRFNIDLPTELEGKTFDIYGISSFYNNNQFLPLEFVEAQEPVTESFVSFDAPEHATISAALEDGTVIESRTTKVAEGDKVILTIVAEEGYTINSVSVVEGLSITPSEGEFNGEFGAPRYAAGDEVTLTDEGDNTYSFIMPAGDVTVNVEVAQAIHTAITDINAAQNGNVRYVNAMGQVSNRPFNGINIVIDGDKTYKIVK